MNSEYFLGIPDNWTTDQRNLASIPIGTVAVLPPPIGQSTVPTERRETALNRCE